ncbi:hypothetical protein [Jatrophihabitans sp.]|uniref:hypothetical protein n=1 Tax=Jatrophihabitans sp. TaxID=1932789 RepID=UPI0030C7725A|nr:hypothetical protein [Jatrophihabitans sp.]
MSESAPPKPPLQVRLRRNVGARVRRTRKRLDNPEVRAARNLALALEQGPVDVLHFGASESLFTADYDEDRRTLPQLYAAGLPQGTRFHSVVGPGYHPALFKTYLDIAAAHGSRPLLIIGLCIRLGEPAWLFHPEYGYVRPLAKLRKIKPGARSARFRALVPPASPAEMKRHDELPHSTVAGTMPVSEYRRRLKNPAAAGLDADQALHLLMAYHHGATVELDEGYLADATALGARVRELGLDVVLYQMPVPMEQAKKILGPEVQPFIEARMLALENAFQAGFSPDGSARATIVHSGTSLPNEMFIDPNDGSEHVNELGRHHIADQVVAEVLAKLSS